MRDESLDEYRVEVQFVGDHTLCEILTEYLLSEAFRDGGHDAVGETDGDTDA